MQKYGTTFDTAEKSMVLVETLAAAITVEYTAALLKVNELAEDPVKFRALLGSAIEDKRDLLDASMKVLGSRCEPRFCEACLKDNLAGGPFKDFPNLNEIVRALKATDVKCYAYVRSEDSTCLERLEVATFDDKNPPRVW